MAEYTARKIMHNGDEIMLGGGGSGGSGYSPICYCMGNGCAGYYQWPSNSEMADVRVYYTGGITQGGYSAVIRKGDTTNKGICCACICNITDTGFCVAGTNSCFITDVVFYGDACSSVDPASISTKIFGTGEDGDLVVTDKIYKICAKEWNFNNLTICPDATLYFEGQGVPVLRVKGTFCNMGRIMMREPLMCNNFNYTDKYSGISINNRCNSEYSCALALKTALDDMVNCCLTYEALSTQNALGGPSQTNSNLSTVTCPGGNGGGINQAGFTAASLNEGCGGAGGSAGVNAGGGGGGSDGYNWNGTTCKGCDGCPGGNGYGGDGGDGGTLIGSSSAATNFIGASGGGGGFGCLGGGKGGNGGVICNGKCYNYITYSYGGNGGNSYCGNGGDGGCGGTFYSSGGTPSIMGHGGDGGNTYYGNGGNGGKGCNCKCGNGGCTYWGQGGSGHCGGCSYIGDGGCGYYRGGNSYYGNGGCANLAGSGKGGCSLYGDGGNGCQCGGWGLNGGNGQVTGGYGGSAWHGSYGLGLFANILKNEGNICGGGGCGGHGCTTTSYSGHGGDGSELYIVTKDFTNSGIITYDGGEGGSTCSICQGKPGIFKLIRI